MNSSLSARRASYPLPAPAGKARLSNSPLPLFHPTHAEPRAPPGGMACLAVRRCLAVAGTATGVRAFDNRIPGAASASDLSGGFTGGATPVPIPNTVVKPVPADGSPFRARVGGRRSFLSRAGVAFATPARSNNTSVRTIGRRAAVEHVRRMALKRPSRPRAAALGRRAPQIGLAGR